MNPKIHPDKRCEIADMQPDDRLRLILLLNEFQLTADEVAALNRLRATGLVQTSFLATVVVRAGDAEAVADLGSVRAVW